MPELLDLACAVYFCGIIIKSINGLQASQKDDRVIAHHFPDRYNGDSGDGIDFIG